MCWFNKKDQFLRGFVYSGYVVGIISLKSRSLDVLFCVVCGVMLCHLN